MPGAALAGVPSAKVSSNADSSVSFQKGKKLNTGIPRPPRLRALHKAGLCFAGLEPVPGEHTPTDKEKATLKVPLRCCQPSIFISPNAARAS